MSIHSFFSTDCASGSVKGLEYMCYVLLCCVCGLSSVSLWLPLGSLICGFVQFLFLSLVINF